MNGHCFIVLMSLTAWLSLFTVSLLGAMSPGPSLAVIVKNTLGGGRKNGIITSWSHAAGIGLYALLTMVGLVVVLKGYPALFRGISYAGAFYLGWLGWKSLRAKGGVAAALAARSGQSLVESARDGIMISALNPKIGLFFLALFSQVMDPDVGFFGQFITVFTPFCTDGCWYTFVVLVLSRQNILESLRQKAVVIDRVTGIVLILLALRVVISG